MPHAYDTGLLTSQRDAIMAGLLATLEPLRYVTTPSPSGYLRGIVEFAGEVTNSTDNDGLSQLYALLQGRSPAIAVSVGEKSYNPAGQVKDATQWRSDYTVEIYFASTHGRSLEKRMSGDVVSAASMVADPGLNTAMEHVEQLLIGRDLGINTVFRLVPIFERPIIQLEELTLWKQGYRLRVQRNVTPTRDLTTLLQEIQTLHNIDGVDMDVPPLIDILTEIDP